MNYSILGKLSAPDFLRQYWQKKPLLIRNALPNFKGFLPKKGLFDLSNNEEIQSRLVSCKQGQWDVLYGPFRKKTLTQLTGEWTLLVQGINYFLPEAETLLKNFNFIPHARLDDLMISFAPDGGGVGPHFDSYDVFLLQGSGKRLWQISKQKDQSLLPDVPLRILKNFVPEEEFILEPGDMLYLPPNYAHNGVAIGDCMTYSIGFRALSHQEIAMEFLVYLQDNLELAGRYSDPGLKVGKHPAQISNDMLAKVASVIKKIQFKKTDIEKFLGQYLTEPKSQIFFHPPESPMVKTAFFKLAKKKGLCLDLKSQLLFTQKMFYMNGEIFSFNSAMPTLIKELADHREIGPFKTIDKKTGDLLYEWYLQGNIRI